MKNKFFSYILLIFITFHISSCTTISDNNKSSPDDQLPTGYSIANITTATDEFINYILWSNPEEVIPRLKGSEPYFGQQVTVEVRIYSNDTDNKNVYAHTNVSIWQDVLLKFDIFSGILYCTDEVTLNDELWPKGSYEVIDTFTIEVQPLREPHFGTSTRKDQMISAMENKLQAMCKDFTGGSEGDSWINSDIYLVDFNEYESSSGAYFVRRDGYVSYSPFVVELNKTYNEFVAKGVKGFHFDSMNKNDPGSFIFDRQMQHTVKHYVCTRSGLKLA